MKTMIALLSKCLAMLGDDRS